MGDRDCDPLPLRTSCLVIAGLWALAWVLIIWAFTGLVRWARSDTLHELRVKKATILVKAFYDHPGRANFGPYCDYLVSTHEAIEAEGLRKKGLGIEGYEYAEGYGAAWWWSMVYGGANFSLRCYGKARGGCAGPMDVKHWPRVLDPQKNIRWHCEEMWEAYKVGTRGLALCEYVMLPDDPRDWDIDEHGDGRFARTDAKHRKRITLAYREGELP